MSTAWWEQTPAARATRKRIDAATLEADIDRLEALLAAKREALIALLTNKESEGSACQCCCCKHHRAGLGSGPGAIRPTNTGDQ